MDEIVIEEKKYISSKQAAKITGYAKDYIGQLCREGRVPARLVGRSWYVLESAIQDHRFGAKTETPIKEESLSRRFPQSTWESPRYEAIERDELWPSIPMKKNDIRVPEMHGVPEAQKSLQDTWQEWFSSAASGKEQESSNALHDQSGDTDTKDVELPSHDGSQIENVPITFVHRMETVDLSQKKSALVPEKGALSDYARPTKPVTTKKTVRMVNIILMSIACVGLVLAILGSGFADAYVVGNDSISSVSGVTVYIR